MGQFMSVADAAYNVVHGYPGGAAALQVRMGKTNLSAEVNPNNPGAKLGLEDAVTVQVMAKDFRILYAMAVECGHFPPMPLPESLPGADQPCIRTASEVVKEAADVLHTTVESLADNDVSDNDLARFDKEWSELIVKGQALRQQMAYMNARLKVRAA
jgi:hypothetical protein